MKSEHAWHTVNREVHGTEEIDRRDLLAEIGAALDVMSDEDVGFVVGAIDRGHYGSAGYHLALGLRLLSVGASRQ